LIKLLFSILHFKLIFYIGFSITGYGIVFNFLIGTIHFKQLLLLAVLAASKDWRDLVNVRNFKRKSKTWLASEN